MFSLSDNSHPSCVVNLWFKGPTFRLLATVGQSKGQTFINKPPYRDKGTTVIPGEKVIKYQVTPSNCKRAKVHGI